ncbi:MAG: response regulator [Denitrovibrio sp.]|nr:MAG: response regulator [Denitrovibrio sp.]
MIKVLYAEDEPITRMLVADILSGYCEVVSTSNGAEALEEFKKGGFDLIITDLSMPKMSGFELIYKVKEANPDLPILVTTAFREEYSGIEDLAQIIEKPLDIDKFIKLIEAYCK